MKTNPHRKPRTGKPVGRPDHQPTAKLRRDVELCVAAGMSVKEIASSCGIGWKTLEKYYQDELTNGRALIKREAMRLLMRSARQGNVSAQRKIYAIANDEDDEVKIPGTRRKVGKKEEVQIKADNVSGKYAPPEPPRLIVDNSRKAQ